MFTHVFDDSQLIQTYAQILSRLRALKNRPLIIGINGIDGAGKTTYANALSRFLLQQGHRTQVVHVDDFHNERAIRYAGPDEASNFYRKSINFDALETLILKPIKSTCHLKATLTLLDLETDTYTLRRHYDISPTTIVIVEGIFLFKRELRAYFDLAIFLDVSFDEAVRRARQRDTHIPVDLIEERYRKKYHAGQRLYFSNDRPLETVDILISQPET